jgi:hypothetical protein
MFFVFNFFLRQESPLVFKKPGRESQDFWRLQQKEMAPGRSPLNQRRGATPYLKTLAK